MVNTANLLSSRGNHVTLIILDITATSFYTIEPAVRVLQHPLSFGISRNGNVITRKIRMLSDVLKLRKILSALKADVVISSEYPFTVALVLSGAKRHSRIYSWEHHHYNWLDKNKFWTRLLANAYPKLNGIICLNQEEKAYYEKFTAATVIPNYIENISGKISMLGNKQLLTIGRLIHRKGIDLLIPVARKILEQHPDWTWKIIGDGEMKEQVLAFSQDVNLGNRLILEPPKGNDLTQAYCESSLFVLTSRFEAFPMVLLEAMSHGLPCVSFNCPSGPSEIITDAEDGLLVENGNKEDMFRAIERLITNEPLRKKMGEKAIKNIRRYSSGNIYSLWERVIQ